MFCLFEKKNQLKEEGIQQILSISVNLICMYNL